MCTIYCRLHAEQTVVLQHVVSDLYKCKILQLCFALAELSLSSLVACHAMTHELQLFSRAQTLHAWMPWPTAKGAEIIEAFAALRTVVLVLNADGAAAGAIDGICHVIEGALQFDRLQAILLTA